MRPVPDSLQDGAPREQRGRASEITVTALRAGPRQTNKKLERRAGSPAGGRSRTLLRI